MKKLAVIFTWILFCTSFAYAKDVYIIVSDGANAYNTIGIQKEIPDGIIADTKNTAKQELTKKLVAECQNKYHGTPAHVVCITYIDADIDDYSPDESFIGGQIYTSDTHGKMYCRTDASNYDWLRNEKGTKNFPDCRERVKTTDMLKAVYPSYKDYVIESN